jgi:acyl-homoserine-lactone acylase
MLNPPAGFVFNTNNSPFLCTSWQDNLDSTNYARFPKHAGYSHGINNRALRFMEIIEQEATFDFDAFKAIKFDQQFPKCSPFLASCESLFNLDTVAYPHLASSLGLLHRWNRHVDLASAEATLFAVTIDQLFAAKGMGYEQFFSGFSAHPPEMAKALEDAQDYLMAHFNSIDVPWGDIQRLVRGEVNLPLPGYFDMLAANYSRPAESGQYEAWVGDAYTQFAVFGPDGLERLETLLPYGSSTRPENAHYTDQMALYTAHQTKAMPLDTSIILEQAQSIYRLPVVP